ncbi:MAG: hypothetical protein NT133_07715 [Alphaproteobacteria bacterium]|nr:hypothetical protein [Alphaproteobacteria bacterium]
MRTALAILALTALSLPASAALRVHSPIVEQGEFELETAFDVTGDHRPQKTGAYTANVALSYGVTSFWKVELEGQWKRDPQNPAKFDATSFGNIFQVTEQGKYAADLGFFLEYEAVSQRGDHSSVTFGPLIQAEFGSNLTTLNLLFTHELGNRSAPGLAFEARLQSVWPVNDAISAGFEAYWQPGRLGAFPLASAQGLRSGPVVVGDLRLPGLGKLKYELGYLFGITGSTPQGTLRGVLEYEFRF